MASTSPLRSLTFNTIQTIRNPHKLKDNVGAPGGLLKNWNIWFVLRDGEGATFGPQARDPFGALNLGLKLCPITGSGNEAHRIRRNNFRRWYHSGFTEFRGRRVRVDADSNPESANTSFFGFAQTGTAGDVYQTHAGVPAARGPVLDPLLDGVSRAANAKGPAPCKGAFGTVNLAEDCTGLGAEGFLKATTSPASRITPVAAPTLVQSADGSSVMLGFGSRASVFYKLQYTVDGSAWSAESGWLAGTGSPVEATYAMAGVRKVFRMITNE